MTLWRLVAPQYAAGAFTGEGSRLYGGRWTSPGVAAVYASASFSLAVLEVLVHLSPDRVPPDYFLAYAVTVPARLIEESPVTLPPGGPTPEQAFGDRWVREARSVAVRVPSVIVPVESNFVLNPAHPDSTRLRRARPRQFSLDLRLLQWSD